MPSQDAEAWSGRLPNVSCSHRALCQPLYAYPTPSDEICDADISVANVDWALLNFMQDWFPNEARAKLKQNEKEASDEELIELGLDPSAKCVIM